MFTIERERKIRKDLMMPVGSGPPSLYFTRFIHSDDVPIEKNKYLIPVQSFESAGSPLIAQ